MMKSWTGASRLVCFLIFLLLGGALPSAVCAQIRNSLVPVEKLLTEEAEVFVEKPGLNALMLPTWLLKKCEADLSDLRLFDGKGAEVPFSLYRGFMPVEKILLKILKEERGPQISQFILERPENFLIDRLLIETPATVLNREISVFDVSENLAETLLGKSLVSRKISSKTPVPPLEIPLEKIPRGKKLKVVIQNFLEVPFEPMQFLGESKGPPALVTSLTAGGSHSPVLRFGGGRVMPVSYDTTHWLSGDSFQNDPRRLPQMRLSFSRSNPLLSTEPVFSELMIAGAVLNERLFTHRRGLTIPQTPEGISTLALSLEDLAILRPDLADLRVVDANHRQWPYLLSGDFHPVRVHHEVSTRSSGSLTTYEIALRSAPLTLDHLNLVTEQPLLNRSYILLGMVERKSGAKHEWVEEKIAQGNLVRRMGEKEDLNVQFPPVRVRSLKLLVENQNESPLVLQSIFSTVKLYDLCLLAPAGEYTLLLGNPKQGAPHYALGSVSDYFFHLKSVEVTPGTLEENPNDVFEEPSALGAHWQKLVFWGLLILSVFGLGAMSLKLAQKEGEGA